MKLRHWLGGISILALLAGQLLFVLPGLTQDDGSTPDALIPEHAEMTSYEGPQDCLECHAEEGREIAESVHYTMQTERHNLVGSEEITMVGMGAMYCGLPATVDDFNWLGLLQPKDASLPAQPGGCAQCHVTMGAKPNPIEQQTEADYANADCLMCHSSDYKRTVANVDDKLRFVPAEGVDVLAAAQNVHRPTNDTCLRCHANAGGGLNAKHGVIPTESTDVHIAAGMQCVDCHRTEDHKIMGGSDVKAQDVWDETVTCQDCHDEGHQSTSVDALLDQHAETIACQTCHIPALARDPNMPTVIERDYGRAVYNEAAGLYGPAQVWRNNVMPEYHWWNRNVTEPPAPVGSRGDGLLTPWKHIVSYVPVDEDSGEIIPMKRGPYLITGYMSLAASQGAAAQAAMLGDEDAEYGGYDLHPEHLLFTANHQVAPAKDALNCTDCHNRNGRLDWEALGYTSEEVDELLRFGAE